MLYNVIRSDHFQLVIIMVNRESPSCVAGRIVGRLILIGLGYVLGKHWGRKPIDKGFPKKNN
jgi:hypothetical protein